MFAYNSHAVVRVTQLFARQTEKRFRLAPIQDSEEGGILNVLIMKAPSPPTPPSPIPTRIGPFLVQSSLKLAHIRTRMCTNWYTSAYGCVQVLSYSGTDTGGYTSKWLSATISVLRMSLSDPNQ